LAGLLSGSGSGSSRGALPNVFLEEPFFSKKQRSPSGGAVPNRSLKGVASFQELNVDVINTVA